MALLLWLCFILNKFLIFEQLYHLSIWFEALSQPNYGNQISFRSMSRNHKFVNSKARPNIQLRNPSSRDEYLLRLKNRHRIGHEYMYGFIISHTYTAHSHAYTHAQARAHRHAHTKYLFYYLVVYVSKFAYMSVKGIDRAASACDPKNTITMIKSPFTTSPWRREHNTDVYFEILAVTWPLHIPLKRSFKTSKICVSLNITWTSFEVLTHWTGSLFHNTLTKIFLTNWPQDTTARICRRHFRKHYIVIFNRIKGLWR